MSTLSHQTDLTSEQLSAMVERIKHAVINPPTDATADEQQLATEQLAALEKLAILYPTKPKPNPAPTTP